MSEFMVEFEGTGYSGALKNVYNKLPDDVWKNGNGEELPDNEFYSNIKKLENTPYIILSFEDLEHNKDKILPLLNNHDESKVYGKMKQIPIYNAQTANIKVKGVSNKEGYSEMMSGKMELSIGYDLKFTNGTRQIANINEISFCKKGKKPGCFIEKNYKIINFQNSEEINYCENNFKNKNTKILKIRLSLDIDNKMNENNANNNNSTEQANTNTQNIDQNNTNNTINTNQNTENKTETNKRNIDEVHEEESEFIEFMRLPSEEQKKIFSLQQKLAKESLNVRLDQMEKKGIDTKKDSSLRQTLLTQTHGDNLIKVVNFLDQKYSNEINDLKKKLEDAVKENEGYKSKIESYNNSNKKQKVNSIGYGNYGVNSLDKFQSQTEVSVKNSEERRSNIFDEYKLANAVKYVMSINPISVDQRVNEKYNNKKN